MWCLGPFRRALEVQFQFHSSYEPNNPENQSLKKAKQLTECNKSLTDPQLQAPAAFVASVFHSLGCSVSKMTQTAAWRNLSESRSEVRVQFSRVYLSISCSTRVMCANKAEECRPPNANVKIEAQTRVRVIFRRGGGLPHDQAEKTVVGGGDVN